MTPDPHPNCNLVLNKDSQPLFWPPCRVTSMTSAKHVAARCTPLLLFVMSLFVANSPIGAQEAAETLFAPLPPEERDWAAMKIRERMKKEKALVQVDYVRLRSGGMLDKALRAGLAGLPIRPVVLHLPKLPPVTIVTERVVQQSQGFIAWSGRI